MTELIAARQPLRIANAREHALSGGIYTGDLNLGLQLAGRLRSGTVQVNTGFAAGYTPPDLTLVREEHTRRYLETDGAFGHEWSGVYTLLLTTTGRKSGKSSISPMIYGQDGANYVVIASQGGLPKHPHWYLNLLDEPAVEIQVGAARLTAKAHAAEGEERDRLWKLMTSIWPNFDVYQTRTTRRIPVVVLVPVE